VRRSVLAVAVALLALAGCGGGDDGADTPPADRGTRLHEVAPAGFSLHLPSDWRAVPDLDVLETELESFREENPEVERYLRAVLQNELIEFFAFDPDVRRGFATNVNVVRFPVDGTPSFAEWSERVVAETERLPTRVGGVEHSRESLPAGEALRIEYENEFRTNAGENRVATRQYVFVVDERGYVLTFSTLPEQAETYAAVFRAAAESFRIAQ
jgi:hypothetical protein